MSKIGRMPILFSSAKVVVDGSKVLIDGPKAKFEHEIPSGLIAKLDGNKLCVSVEDGSNECKASWGLHRALLANKVKGAEVGFEKKVIISGLGYKAVQSGNNLKFFLGYSNPVDYEMPKEVSVNIDKAGQTLIFSSADKFLLGRVCDDVRSFRPIEPYKGRGITREGDIVVRKAGKAKSTSGS